MYIYKNYFLLYHCFEYPLKNILNSNLLKENLITKDINFYENISLILTIDKENYKQYSTLKSFNQILDQIYSKKIENIDDIYLLQKLILNEIKLYKEEINTILNSFKYLKEHKIITKEKFDKLNLIFMNISFNKMDNIDKENNKIIDNKTFQENRVKLNKTIKKLTNIIKSSNLLNNLDMVNKYLKNQKFSIGITGIMNAGKSTMLNALIGQDILGSSVVPETATLTVLNYSKEKNANVYYWNESEWNNIYKSSQNIKSMKKFVDDTNKHFNTTINEYIKKISRVDKIDIENIGKYTSAKTSDKKCNLIKSVELNLDLNFLKDNIQIVDTPGLDDPVIQREEITKEYLNKCDLMIHLMNVNQCASLKDIEFIIDAILYQNITKLLIVISRCDTVTKQELEEVINYTKESIKKHLHKINKDDKTSNILNSIEFIPVASKLALLHKTNQSQKAIKLGYNLEDTGIPKLEAYLYDTLFGKNSKKSNLIVQSVKFKLKNIINIYKDELEYKLKLLSKSKEELCKNLEDLTKKIILKENFIKNINDEIKNDRLFLIDDLILTNIFLETELFELQNILRQRVIDDISYCLEKTKKRPQTNRLKIIIQTAIKDGIVDIIRDYKFNFIQKLEKVSLKYKEKYKKYSINKYNNQNDLNPQILFQNDFKSGFITSNNDILISEILKTTSKSTLKSLENINSTIQNILKDNFSILNINLKNKITKISKNLLEDFFYIIENPIRDFEKKMYDEQKILKIRVENSDNSNYEKNLELQKINNDILKLEQIEDDIK
jgi:predicted GTPase